MVQRVQHVVPRHGQGGVFWYRAPLLVPCAVHPGERSSSDAAARRPALPRVWLWKMTRPQGALIGVVLVLASLRLQLYIFSYTAAGRNKRARDLAAKQARMAKKAE